MFTCYASTYANEFVVQSFEKVDNDLSARRYERKDVNDTPCAIIKIRSDIPKPFVFDANMGIEGNAEYKDNNEIWVYVSEGERQLTIAKEGFVTLKYPIPQMVESLSVYSLVLKAKDNKFSVVIISDPPDAQKYIDGELLGPGEQFDIEKGERLLEIKKDGFITYSRDVNINEENSLFKDIKLSRPEPTELTISSQPSDATIYLNNQDVGQTKKRLIRMPGEYQLRITKNKYESVEDTIHVSSDGENEWSFTLVKAVGKLSISTTPEDVEILINGEPINAATKELAAGGYQIEVRKSGWHSKIQNITMVKGVDQDLQIQLVQKTGKLELTVEPYETQVLFEQNGDVLESWRGTQFKKDIPVGNYSIFLSAKGYQEVRKSLSIVEENTMRVDVKLKKLYYVKPRGQALWRSTLLPGYGQYYEDRWGMASLFLAGETVLLLQLLDQRSEYRALHEEYLEERSSYSSFQGSSDEFQLKWEQVQLAYDKTQKNYQLQQVTLGLMGSIYIWNLVDAWVKMPKYTDKNLSASLFTDGQTLSAEVKVKLP
jgi:archaellum component FlaG (FlaF/FlaG flagellin family)